MKKSVRILLTVVAIVLVAALSVAIATAEGTTPGTVSEATTLLGQATSAPDLDAKAKAFYTVTQYLAEHPIDEGAEGYAAFLASFNEAKLETAEALLAECEKYSYEPKDGELIGLEPARKMGAVNALKTFVERNPIDDTTEGYADFIAKYNAEVAAKDAYKEASRQAADDVVNLDEYSFPIHINSDYNGSPKNMSLASIGNTKEYQSKLIVNPETGKRVWSISYYGTTSGYSAYYPKNVSDSVIVQFDIRFNEMVDNGFQLEQEIVGTRWFRIEADGTINTGSYLVDGKVNTAEGVKIHEGQWVNIALVINLENAPYTYDVYIDYQKVFEGCTASPWAERTYNNIRFSGSNTKGNYYMDNVYIYRGTTPRTTDRLEKMTTAEKYVYYANYAADETKTAPTRQEAYNLAGEIYRTNGILDTGSAEIIAAKAVYDSVDYAIVHAAACEYNTERFVALVNKVASMERHPDTEEKRNTALDKVETFISSVGSDLLTDSKEYKTAAAALNVVRANLVEEKSVKLFNAKMLRFAAASTLVAMQTHYDEAKALLEDISVDIGSVPGFEDFAKHYAVYLSAADTLHEATLESNSKKVVDCVGFISRYTTEEEWVANYDKMERYVLIIRETLASGLYDMSYDGFVAALNIFNPIEEFFYARLQVSHIAYIKEQFALYEAASAYVDQVGIIATIKRYVETADIDKNNEELADLLVQLDYYDAEIQVRGEDYALVLRENAAKFILLIDELIIQNGYANTRAAFDRATAYYNSIDRDYEGVAEAIAIYKEYEAEFDVMDVSTKAFCDSVALLATVKRDEDIYAILVDCYYFYDNVNTEAEGIDEIIAVYQTAYDEYNATYVTVNSDIDEAVNCAVSVRANCGVDSIVAIICKLLLGK